MPYVVRADGLYVVDGNREIKLDGVVRVTSAGRVVLRIPSTEVTVIDPLDLGQWLDCSSFQRCLAAVVFGGVTIAQISAVRPGVAAAVQTFMNNNGLSPGTVD
jgi:hypothetical protein